MIKETSEGYIYFDKNGVQIKEGDTIRYPNGSTKEVYLTTQGKLGVDATNPLWIETGRAIPCEYGIYPFDLRDTEDIEVVR